MTRVAIVRDLDGKWFVRRISYSVSPLATPIEKASEYKRNTQRYVYHCDEHIGGPYDTLSVAAAKAEQYIDAEEGRIKVITQEPPG